MTDHYRISLAPEQLWQAINPMTIFNQGGQFGLININLGQTPRPDIEQKILDEVGSYGRQIGRIGDALQVLMDHIPLDGLDADEKDALAVLRGELAEIRKIKRRERSASAESV
ncbi:hypothetical protein [Allosphingosinicella deserti]|uniref:Uncharacterized protein n=1 Tax=Allosphingosinicella deserti TaxID=2116704 RepID=A0A2P7QF77_9SPHN|nr:hypothetical protein [Sphingomonas deserti]PSJ36575.1 hypothetical protein C7I55_26170 [Sphingomonas deserti]